MSKIIAITTIGTYYSPWFEYGIASIYNHVDEIVVVNHGYNMFNPQDGIFCSLDKASQSIKKLDVNGKITELKNITEDTPIHKMILTTQKGAENNHDNNWFDIRGINLTCANEEAFKRGADWILKMDSDQVCYSDIKNLRRYLDAINFPGIYLYQYEFIGPVDGRPSFESKPAPSSPYHDSIFAYKSIQGQYYGGGGSPALFLPGGDRVGTELFHCAHLRQANPSGFSELQKFEHFYGRYWFAEFTNHYGKFCRELDQVAKQLAESKLKEENTLSRPEYSERNTPQVCGYLSPLEYINAGY